MTITLQDFVHREIVYCASSLVGVLRDAAAGAPKMELSDGTSWEELVALSERPNWENAVEVYIDALSRGELIEALDEAGIEDEEGQAAADALLEARSKVEDYDMDIVDHEPWQGVSDADLKSRLLKHLDDEGEFKEFAENHNIDPEYDEVYEHWIVTDWLAEKLAEKGEVTGEVCGLTIWGRCTTGQAIYIDWVIQEIYKDWVNRHAST